MTYHFEQASTSALDAVCRLIDQRIRWMDEVGIRQWNVTNYWQAYPMEYYRDQIQQGRLYVLKTDTQCIVGALVLLEADPRWEEDSPCPAYYLHNFVTDVQEKGAGSQILAAVEMLAAAHGKQALRLDCALDNGKLNRYYEAAGYQIAGQCREGLYIGNKREKRL